MLIVSNGIGKLQKETLSERIEMEEEFIRKGNLDRLEEFLSKAESQNVSIDYHGIRFFEELSWTYTRDKKTIIISDEDESKIYGLQQIDLKDILSCGLQMFCMDEDVFEIDFYNDTMVISID